MRARERRIPATVAAAAVLLAVAGAPQGTPAWAAATRPVSAVVDASGRAGPGEPVPGARYRWPLAPPTAVTTPFRPPQHPYGPGHRGVDLAGTVGQRVSAARGGTVVFAGPVGGRGVVSVQHADGLRTTYEPLSTTVTSGEVVATGDELGRLEPGHAGCPAAACLHWGVLRDRAEYLDPLALLRPPRVRLLPVPDPWPLNVPAA